MSPLEKRMSNMENQMASIVKIIFGNKKNTEYDINAGRFNTSRAQRTADDATEYCNENEKEIELTMETLETIMEDVIPKQAMTSEELFETIDTIMTEVIPNILKN